MSADPSAAQVQQAAEPQQYAVVRFMLDAETSPGLLPRLLQPFARRDLTPDRMWAHRNGAVTHVEIAMDAMPAEMVHLVEGNLRQVVGVQRVFQMPVEGLRRVA